MNIFLLHKDPKIAAQMHCDQHVVKMPIESAQMLSSAHHVLSPGVVPDGICKMSYQNHPCSVWVRESKENYRWLLHLMICLCYEFTYRYGKQHSIQNRIDSLRYFPHNIPDLNRKTTPAQAMPDDCKRDNPVQAYRTYYLQEKKFARWTRRSPPHWWFHSYAYPDTLRQKRLRQ